MKGFKMFFLAMVMLVGLLASIDVEAGSVVISENQHLVTLSVGPGGNIDCLMPKQEAIIEYDDQGNQKIVVKTIPGYFPVAPSDVRFILAFSYKTGFLSDRNLLLYNTYNWTWQNTRATFAPTSLTATIPNTANNDRTWWYVILNDQTVRRINTKKLSLSYGGNLASLDPSTIKLMTGGCVQYGQKFTLPRLNFNGNNGTISGFFNMNTIGSTMGFIKQADIANICWKSFVTDDLTCTGTGLQTDSKTGNLYFIIRDDGKLLNQDIGNVLLYRSDGYWLGFLAPRKWQLSKNAEIWDGGKNLFYYDFTLPMK